MESAFKFGRQPLRSRETVHLARSSDRVTSARVYPRRCSLKRPAFSLCVLALLMPASSVQAQTKHTPSFTESLSLKAINGEQISPDGKFIAYRLRETDWKENAYV